MNTVPVKDATLRGLLRTIDRRRYAVLVTFSLVFTLAVCACLFMTRRYEASSVVQLQKSSSDSFGLDGLMGAASGGASDSLSLNVDLQTQVSILKSDTLAVKVIKDLNLEQTPDFKGRFSLVGWLTNLISPDGPPDPGGDSTIDTSPRRRSRALKVFQEHLDVKVDAGTRLLEVSFVNRDPKVAAAVVNHLVQALIDYTFQTKFTATNEVSSWLESQLGDLRTQSEGLQKKVVALQQSSGIFGVGGSDLQGKPVIYSPVLDRLTQSTAQLSQAKMNRVLKGSVYEVTKSGNAELISQLSGTSIAGTSSQGVTSSLTLIQNLREQESTLRAQIDQDSSQFGSAYPKLAQERASLRGVEKSIADEVFRIGERAKNDFKVAIAAQSGAESTYNNDRDAAEKLNDKSIEYAILSKEADQSQDLYQDLLKRLKEAGILEGLHSSNLTIVDLATPPAKPSQPKVPLYLFLGFVLGLVLGVCVALLVDAIDNKAQGVEEIEAMGFPLLGIIPQFEVANSVAPLPVVLGSEYSAFGEAIRGLRSTLLISRSGNPPQVLLVTSGSQNEGKSTVAVNLAASLSQLEKKVLLIESDMRRPVLRKRLALPGKGGLSVMLSSGNNDPGVVTLSGYPNFHILPAGPTPPYPAELLGSQRMRTLLEGWRKEYDFVVIDSPPVLPVSDSQVLEELVDATVLIARVGYTARLALQRAYRLLFQHAKSPTTPDIGVVLNFVSTRSAAYYGYYGYYGSEKYDSGNGEENADS